MISDDSDKIILGYCFQDKVFLAKVAASVTGQYFSPDYRKFAGVVIGYYKKHKRTITWNVFEAILKNKKAPIEKILHYQRLYDSVGGAYDANEFEFHFGEFRKRHWTELFKDALGRKNGLPGAIDFLVDEKNPVKAWERIKEVGLKIEVSRQTEEVKRGDIKESVNERLEKYNYKKVHPEEAYGLLTGFKALDEATKGLRGGEVLVVAGRPGSGKSTFALVASKNVYKLYNKNVLLISIEMPKEQYELRFDASYSGLMVDKIELGTLDIQEEERYKKSLEEIQQRKNWFYIIDTFRCTPLTVEAELEMVMQKFRPDLLVIDYIGIMKADEHQKSDNEEQARIIEGVRRIARQYDLPVIVPVQLNRDMTKHRKGTERLSRSDVIGQTADVVLQIEEKDDTDEVSKLDSNITFHFVKNRKGKASDPFTMYYNPALMAIEDREYGALGNETQELD